MPIPRFCDLAPDTDELTAYDRRHLTTYLTLLDAAAEGADWREVVQVLFGIDAAQEPRRAQLVHDSHLARAHWMTECGYRHLVRSAHH